MAAIDWVLYALAVVIWGSTWLAMTFQLGVVAPEISLVYRYVLATVLLFVFCLLWRAPLRFDRRTHVQFVGLGVTLFGLNYLATYWAQQYITSALNALAFSSMVWMNIVLARIFFKAPISLAATTGAAMGMAGVVLMFWPRISHLNLGDETVLGASFCLFGALTASFGNMLSQKSQRQGTPVLGSTAWAMFYGTLFLATFAILRDQPWIFDMRPGYLISLGYLAVFGSVIGFLAYLKLLGRIGAERAGYAVVMFPIVALCLSVWFEGLNLDGTMLVGVGLILLGNVFILGRKSTAPRALPLDNSVPVKTQP